MTGTRRTYFVWLLAASVALFAFNFVYLRGQDKNWDLLNYHFYAGYSLLHGNFLQDIAPMGLVSFLNPAPNVLAFLALSKLAFPFSAWAITLVQLLSIPLLVLIGRQLGRELGLAQIGAAEFLALALCLLAPLWWSELGTSFADASTTPLVLLGLYLGLRGVAQGASAGAHFVWAGLCFGLAAGLKLTNAPFAIGFLVALAAQSVGGRWQQTLRQLALLGAGLLGGFLLTAGWNFYLLQHWGSPLFPLYNAWFKSPYADQINFQENVWRFKSVFEFARFLWDCVLGTARTAEFAFADARWLVFFVLLLPVLALRKKFGADARVAFSLLVFMLVAFLLWALVFAYQRYLLPVELLLGFGIWVLLARLSARPRQVVLWLVCCVLASAALIKVPDWGHRPAQFGERNPFGMALPAQASATPARYLVVENAISYILPALHPDSRFYGIDVFHGLFANQTDALVRAAVTRPDALALRFLVRQEVAARSIWETLSRFGFTTDNTGLSCFHFRTEVDTYVMCELEPGRKSPAQAMTAVEIDFQDGSRPLPPALLGVLGLSAQEAWGRWSNDDEVQVVFANCLPQGRFKLDLRGHAFGPNIGKPVRVALGKSQASVVFGAEDGDQSVALENREPCQNTLSIQVPQKVSPAELGLSVDARKLGIGMVRLGIYPSN